MVKLFSPVNHDGNLIGLSLPINFEERVSVASHLDYPSHMSTASQLVTHRRSLTAVTVLPAGPLLSGSASLQQTNHQ